MCLIAYAPSKSLISMESLANAYENNKDGWGICYQDPTTNQLVINKTCTLVCTSVGVLTATSVLTTYTRT
jgi:hypothetical protein